MSDILKQENAIRSFANVMLAMSKLEVPQRIGPMTIRDGAPIAQSTGSQSFETLEDYVSHCFNTKRLSQDVVNNNSNLRAQAEGALSRLEAHLGCLLSSLSSPECRRCVLHHGDLVEMNVLMDPTSGHITGVIDWEFYCIRPLVLAAHYPPWLLYDATMDPRVKFEDQENFLWVVSREEAAHLRDVYAQVSGPGESGRRSSYARVLQEIKLRDEVYLKALVEGELLRQGMEWLACDTDPGCTQLSRWMDEAFPKDRSE